MIHALFYFLASALASEVLLQSPSSSDIEYRAYLRAHSDLQTPTESTLRSRPDKPSREKLIAAYSEAQSAFLNKETILAKAKFAAVGDLLTSDDWHAQDHEVFVLSYLRLAQISTDGTERAEWLRAALLLPGVKFDESLFPPPLLREFKELSKNVQKRKIQFSGLGQEWSRILVNGSSCTLDFCPAIPSLAIPVRITWLSDRWLPYTAIVDADRIEKSTPQRKPWLEGRCQAPIFAKQTEIFAERRAFFDLQCEELVAKIATTELRPKTDSQPTSPVVFAGAKTPTEKNKFYKSPWVWAGVGALVAVIVASSQKKGQDSKDPTTTYGY